MMWETIPVMVIVGAATGLFILFNRDDDGDGHA
jgi:hypothetical protein